MADHTPIEWSDATWNIVTGCTLVSEGCRHCYAARLAATRLKNQPSRKGLARLNAAGEAKFTGEVRFNAQWLDQPLRWSRPRKIFVCAHGDLFHEAVPDEWIDQVFAVMALAPQHSFQVLTKRPERMREYVCTRAGDWQTSLPDSIPSPSDMYMSKAEIAARLGTNSAARELYRGPLVRWPLPNVWLGTSIEDQATADARMEHLRSTPAAVRFVSAEPLLGPVTMDLLGIHWVIVGGESGPGSRPMHPDWARALREQCAAAGVAFLFKQWGEYRPFRLTNVIEAGGGGMPVTAWPDGTIQSGKAEERGGLGCTLERLGKSAAGRLLDGVEHNGFPVAP